MKRNISLIVLILLSLQVFAIGQDSNQSKTGGSENQSNSELSDKLERELNIYKNALLEGSNAQVRKDAAIEMLFHESRAARDILIEILKGDYKKEAKLVICEVIAETRTSKALIENATDFVKPLVMQLYSNEAELASLGAEALLIFYYEEIQEVISTLLEDGKSPLHAKLNAISALRLQPHQKAIIKLIELTEHGNKEIAAAASDAVRSLGIPDVKDKAAKMQIIKEIRQKGKNEFLKDWLIRQESHIKNLETEKVYWQKRYLDSMDNIYESLGDDATKGKFLSQQLNGGKSVVKQWVLEKVEQWRQAPGSSDEFLKEIGPALVGLISDENDDIRLKTADLLSLMVQLNSSGSLLEQLKVEQDEEVKMKLFVALGGACDYAFSANSSMKLDPSIKEETLEWAVKYLEEADAGKAEKGAEVIEKLLEKNGLSVEQVQVYFDKLVQRYNLEAGKNSDLRANLLRACASLCVQGPWKQEAGKKFRSLFEGAIGDASELVREAAVDGLINIDKSNALAKFRGSLVNDPSSQIRKKIIALAEEVGSGEDLGWLYEKLGSGNYESEMAWQSMMKILKGADPKVVSDWLVKIEQAYSSDMITDEQMLSFLETANRKSINGKNPEMQYHVKKKMSEVYDSMGNYAEAAKHIGELQEMVKSAEKKQKLVAELLGIYLRWPNVNSARQLMEKNLLEKDLESADMLIQLLDTYFSSPIPGTDASALYDALKGIKVEKRPNWHEKMKLWGKGFSTAATPDPNSEKGQQAKISKNKSPATP